MKVLRCQKVWLYDYWLSRWKQWVAVASLLSYIALDFPPCTSWNWKRGPQSEVSAAAPGLLHLPFSPSNISPSHGCSANWTFPEPGGCCRSPRAGKEALGGILAGTQVWPILQQSFTNFQAIKTTLLMSIDILVLNECINFHLKVCRLGQTLPCSTRG